jgi:hypothetical protein
MALVALAMHPRLAVAQAVGSMTFESWQPGLVERSVPAGLARVGAPQSVGRVGLGAVIGAAVGVVAVGVIGYHLDRATECDDDFCGIDGILVGGSLGSTTLAPLGAHLANDRRGRLVPSLLAAAAGTGAVWLVAAASDDEEIILAVPFVNILTSVIVERATSR